MNNTDFYVNPLQSFHFLSILTSINVLTNILTEEKLLTDDNRFRPIPLVNSLCEYLHKNKNGENATIVLGKKWINNTDLYGSKENETVNFQYVDAMINHFIASIVFSKFGNSFGYLSAIVNATNNLTLPFVKRKIALDLRKQIYLNQDYTNCTLTQIAVERITKKLIFPLFPQPEKRSMLRIIDVDYIYAQAGLMFARSAGINSHTTSFNEYIVMSQSVEQSYRRGKLKEDALTIFQLPALLYYTYKKQKELRNLMLYINIESSNFWNEAFINLFAHLEAEKQKIEELQKNNALSHFEEALFLYKNRTEYAEYLLRHLCPLESESQYEEEVKEYKFYYSDYYCKKGNFKMPNINDLFSQQNEYIAYRYFLVESMLLEEAFGERLIEFINQLDVAVWPVEIFRKRRCGFRCVPFRENIKDNIVLFEIEKYREYETIYALIRENATMTILSAANDRDGFMQKIGLKNTTKLVVPHNPTALKYYQRSFRVLAENLLAPRRKAFYNLLESQGYDPTTGESVIQFLKIFIPFYNCVENIKTGTVMNAVGACIVDSLILIPLFGQAASTGLKLAKAGITPLLVNFQASMKSFTIGQFVRLSLNFGIRNFAVEASKELSKQVTKELFKNIGIAVLRTLDPGIELSYMLGKAGVTSITKCFSVIGKKVSSLSKVLKSLSKVKQPVVSHIGVFKGHNLYVSSFSGKDGYGIKFFNFNGETVELRRIRGYKREMPVVLVSNPKERKRIYQIKNLKTGKRKATRWEFRNGILVPEVKPLAVRVKTIQVEGLSGRRKTIHPRIKKRQAKLKMCERTIERYKRYINEDTIRHVLQNYILEERWARKNVFEYFMVYRKMPQWSETYKLTNLENYDTLRFKINLEDPGLTEEQAMKLADDLFKVKYRRDDFDIDVPAMYQFYSAKELHSTFTFQDFLAIGSYVMNPTGRVFIDSVEGWNIQNAFNKLSLRMIDFPNYSAYVAFYRVETTSVEVIRNFKDGEKRIFLDMANLDTEVSRSLQSVDEIITDSSSKIVLYELILDNLFMVVNVENLMPSVKTAAVLLPGTVFIVEDAKSAIVNGKEIFKVTLRNTPVSTSVWIAKMNKDIETLNNRIKCNNGVLDDFDLSLFDDNSILDQFDLSLLD